jgi:glycosyltransferase involved in cell wall biosynthesis
LISVVTPCFNEELTVRDCVIRLHRAMTHAGLSFEHILVDNASTDSSLETMIALKAEFPHVRVMSNEFNVGAFRSMQRGIRAATGALVVPFLAADCQDPPELIPKMVEIKIQSGCDTVAGVRMTRNEGRLISLFRRLFYRVIFLATRGKYRAGSSEFRLMPTARAVQLAEIGDATPFLRIYMAQTQGRVEYIEYEMAERTAGVSSASFFPLVDDALNGIMLASPSIFSRLLVFLLPSTSIGLAGLLCGLIFTLAGNSYGDSILRVSAFSTSVSCILLIQSLVGHYVFMIHQQVRSGPTAKTHEV